MTSGLPVRSLDEAVASAKCLLQKGCKNHVLITLGADGALLLSRGAEEKPVHIEAPVVSAIDTTVNIIFTEREMCAITSNISINLKGAGDCFLGALAFFIATHPDLALKKAIENACVVASVSVQRNGTQPSFPRWDELSGLLPL